MLFNAQSAAKVIIIRVAGVFSLTVTGLAVRVQQVSSVARAVERRRLVDAVLAAAVAVFCAFVDICQQTGGNSTQ